MSNFLFAKQSFYDAESSAWELFPECNKLTTLLHCQRYINRITRTLWFVDNFGRHRVQVLAAPKKWGNVGGADKALKKIWVSNSLRCRRALLHELSHVVTQQHGHGPKFLENYFKIVKKFYPKVYKELRKQFRKVGITAL